MIAIFLAGSQKTFAHNKSDPVQGTSLGFKVLKLLGI